MHRTNAINSKFFVRINGHLHMMFRQSCSQSKVYWVVHNTKSPALSLFCLSQWKCLFSIVELTLVFLDVCKMFIDNHICKVANSPLKYLRLECRVKCKFLSASLWWADVDGKWWWFLQNQTMTAHSTVMQLHFGMTRKVLWKFFYNIYFNSFSVPFSQRC